MFDARAHTRLNDPVLIRWYPALGALTGSSAAFGFDGAEAEDASAPGLHIDALEPPSPLGAARAREVFNDDGADSYGSPVRVTLVGCVGHRVGPRI